MVTTNIEAEPMHTAAIIHAEHATVAANDNFAFEIGQRVIDTLGVKPGHP